ncbi:site-specific integrase [uncultured Prochlorococcus sp.]|uniref:site-specific integrase n=1 Tax=uncultured Prochlorococcus sp. TaxID=159733 RepID=UPI00258C8E43|nr:site-specific integrase [uncultured Prochlorococcus sp.]
MVFKVNGRVQNKHFLKGCEEGNAYIFRDKTRNDKWSLYFINKKTKSRHWITLLETDGRYPSPTIDGFNDAERIGTKTFFELKNKTDRGEKTKTLSIRRMIETYIEKEKKRINPLNNPEEGTITEKTWRRMSFEMQHYLQFIKDKEWGLGRSDNSSIHLMDINHLEGYFNYRRRTINKCDRHGKALPRKQTIVREIFNIIRAYSIIGVRQRWINRNQLPLKPKENMTVTTAETQDTRRSMFEREEISALLKVGEKYYQHGISKFDHNGDLYGFDILDGKPILKSVIFGDGTSNRAKHQIKHRKMVYLAMRIALETGLRFGVIKQLKWSNIVEITERSERSSKFYKQVKVPSQINKTNEYFEIPARITEIYDQLKKISNYTKPDDLIFCNQKTGEEWSERIWQEALVDMMIEAGLADRRKLNEDGKPLVNKAMNIRSGKKISWYSFRHSFITFMLQSDGMELHEVSAFCDTSPEYIRKHYYHHDNLSPEILDKLDKGHHRYLKGVVTIKDYEPPFKKFDSSIKEFSKVL